MNEKSLRDIYVKEMKRFFAKLVDEPIGQEDRKIIEKLLQKPWNPYILRHGLATELLGRKNLNTELAKRLFGWAPKSHMPEIYENFDGQEVEEALAQASWFGKNQIPEGD